MFDLDDGKLRVHSQFLPFATETLASFVPRPSETYRVLPSLLHRIGKSSPSFMRRPAWSSFESIQMPN